MKTQHLSGHAKLFQLLHSCEIQIIVFQLLYRGTTDKETRGSHRRQQSSGKP